MSSTDSVPPRDLDGRVALVTGATRGLGLAVARRLCAAGGEVLVNYAHDDDAAGRALEALSDLPGKARLLRADVSSPDDVRRMLTQVTQEYGHLDVLVHCAAGLHPMRAASLDAAACDADRSVVLGPLVHGAPQLATLLRAGTGRLIAVSSSGARQVVPGYLSLGSAKAALESMMRYLAVEFADRQVSVNVVSAGRLDTGPADRAPEVSARVAARTPVGRLTTADEVAGVVALLCRAEAGCLHGQVITVDGGLGLLA
ncbi:MAG: SDR family oxidoreductase [Actinocatenispora sp.]